MVVVVVVVYLSIYLILYLILSYLILSYLIVSYPIYLSIYLSICILEKEAILRDVLSFLTWQHQKRSNDARHRQFLNLTTSKTRQVCETSSFFEVDNIKNETILRDFLQKWKVECRADGLVPMRFATFPFHLSKVTALAMKSEARSRSCEVLHLSRKIILANLKALRKSAPWPPNISDEHVSCTSPGTQNASLLFQCPTPVNAFKTATSPTFCSLLTTRCTIPCACHAKRHLNVQEWNMVCFIHFDFEMCFAPQWRALFHYLNFQKWSYAGVLCTFWLGNVLRATTACTFCTSQLPKVVRSWCVLYNFRLEMCFVPQRRANFHLSSVQMAPYPPL